MSNLNSRDVTRVLQRAGFRIVRQRDHVRLSNGRRFVSMPHYGDLHMRTFRNILKQAGMTVEQYERIEKGKGK